MTISTHPRQKAGVLGPVYPAARHELAHSSVIGLVRGMARQSMFQRPSNCWRQGVHEVLAGGPRLRVARQNLSFCCFPGVQNPGTLCSSTRTASLRFPLPTLTLIHALHGPYAFACGAWSAVRDDSLQDSSDSACTRALRVHCTNSVPSSNHVCKSSCGNKLSPSKQSGDQPRGATTAL